MEDVTKEATLRFVRVLLNRKICPVSVFVVADTKMSFGKRVGRKKFGEYIGSRKKDLKDEKKT